MTLIKRNSLTGFILAAAMVMSLNACGNKDSYEIAEYGTETADTSKEAGEPENEAGVEGTLDDRLGGSEFTFQKDITVRGVNVSFDINYKIYNEIDRIPIYSVRSVTEDDIQEEEIVNNIFGDSAEKLDEEGRELSVENGDSLRIIESGMNAYASFLNRNYSMGYKCAAWVEEEDFFIHTYEGSYRDVPYQMMIIYDREYEGIYYSLYPKNPGDVIGNDTCDHFAVNWGDGNMVLYDENAALGAVTPIGINVNEALAGVENLTQSSSEELEDMVHEIMTEKFECAVYDGMISSAKEAGIEIIFYPGDSLHDPKLSGAVRNGYIVSNTTLAGLLVYRKGMYGRFIGNPEAMVDDEGVFGIGLSKNYEFIDQVSPDSEILDFNSAMASLEKAVQDNIDSIMGTNTRKDLTIDYAELIYYPQPSPDTEGEYALVPAWESDIIDGNGTVGIIYINAMDGSFLAFDEFDF